MEYDIIKAAGWDEIEPIIRGERLAMPEIGTATFPALRDGSNLAAFLRVEHLYHFNYVYVMPEYRGSRVGLQLIEEATAHIPAHHSAIWLTEPGIAQRIARTMGWRNVGLSDVFRKDV